MAKRSYFEEISEITTTWNNVQNSSFPISQNNSDWFRGPLFCIGSGGSLCLAKLWQLIYESHQREPAQTLTPLEFYHTPITPHTIALFSASGKNHDILQVFRLAIEKGCQVIVFTTSSKSALIKLAKSYPKQSVAIYPSVKIPKDGFLAVNSTIAISCMLLQFEEFVWGVKNKNKFPINKAIADNHSEFKLRGIQKPKTFQIITSEWGIPAGLDLESRLSESGLASCFLTDPRNFGHGRFLWLEKHIDSTKLVTFHTDASKSFVNRFLKILPNGLDYYPIKAPFTGAMGSVYCIARSILLFAEFAQNELIDPGKPSVPEWGRKLHRLRYTLNDFSKTNYFLNDFSKKKNRPAFEKTFKTIVLDFDGTIVNTEDRFSEIRKDIIGELERLLDEGLKIGIATGRGSSACISLQNQISIKHHDKIFMGLYNGTLLTTLDKGIPVKECTWHLQPLINSIVKTIIRDQEKISSKATQISIRGINRKAREDLISAVSNGLRQHARYIKFSMSGHSIDILPFWASKIAVVQALTTSLNSEILCIGDQGQIGGNDEELLLWEPSISVGSHQPASRSCLWLGKKDSLRESNGTLYILKNIRKEKSSFNLILE